MFKRIKLRKVLNRKTFIVVSSLILFLGLLVFSSYFFSKKSAEQFVGKTLQSFPQIRVVLLPPPISRNGLVWWFTFSDADPHTFDDGFEIYTNVFGKVVRTNPTDLGTRLTKLENSDAQPNSIKIRKDFELEQTKKQQLIHDRGVSLFRSSSFSKALLDHFTITDIEFQEHSKSKVYFNGPEWRATLLPKKSYPFPCKILAVFPVKNKNKIEASIAPEEIENAIEKCLYHPYVKDYIANKIVTGIRLHITGDRLHWDTSDIQELLVKLKGAEADEKQLRNWVCIYIDGKYQSYMPLYFNPITGELIYREGDTICSPPILIPGEQI